MDILSESMKFFDLNILLDNKDKKNLNAINKNKALASSYKKCKSRSFKYPEGKDAWMAFLDKFNSLIDKL